MSLSIATAEPFSVKVDNPFSELKVGVSFAATKVITVSAPLSATVKSKLAPGELLKLSAISVVAKSVASVSICKVPLPLNLTLLVVKPVDPVTVIISPIARSKMVSPFKSLALPIKLSLPPLPVIESVPEPGLSVSALSPPVKVSLPVKSVAEITKLSPANADASMVTPALIAEPDELLTVTVPPSEEKLSVMITEVMLLEPSEIFSILETLVELKSNASPLTKFNVSVPAAPFIAVEKSLTF